MIKKIHYCWFGKGEKGRLFKKCFKSWKRFFPDYEIIEWNEENFDINCNDYVKRAYDMKKYAFVSDYARLKIIYENGGIYFDTDVEVIKRIDDSILINGYLGEEKNGIIATGLGFSAQPHNKALKIMMDDYEKITCEELEKNNFQLIPCPIMNTESLKKYGFNIKKFEKICNLVIYPPEYFCGYDLDNNCVNITNKTYTIHHYKGSWQNKSTRFKTFVKKIFSRIIGKNNYSKLRNYKKRIGR